MRKNSVKYGRLGHIIYVSGDKETIETLKRRNLTLRGPEKKFKYKPKAVDL